MFFNVDMKDIIIVIDKNTREASKILSSLITRDDSESIYLNDHQEALEYIEENILDGHKWIILSLDEPYTDGINFITSVKVKDPDFKICIITETRNEELIHQCFNAGITDYLLKDLTDDEFIYSLNSIIDNENKTTPEYIELYQVKEVIGHYKIKRRKGREVIFQTNSELPINALINLPDDRGKEHLYRVEKCNLNDMGAEITCTGIKHAF